MWKRLDVSKLRNVGGTHPDQNIRAYGKDGKQWPRLVITVWEDSMRKGRLNISLPEKNKGHWWHHCSLPRELIGELCEMLGEIE